MVEDSKNIVTLSNIIKTYTKLMMIVIIISSRSGRPTKDCDLALFERFEKYICQSILTPKYPPETVTPHYLLGKLYSDPKYCDH